MRACQFIPDSAKMWNWECKDLKLRLQGFDGVWTSWEQIIIIQILEACHFEPVKLLYAEHINCHEIN